jgi:predicted HAD superfamily Cof-like phosphohydrolase
MYGHAQQNEVAEFHAALDIPIGDTPALRRVDLRCALIAEECRETIEAAENGDLVGAIDGLCDVLYVVYGAALEWGVDLAPFWDEVQRSNMAKVGGPTRPDGKRLKPEGWQPPDIAGVLRAQVAKASPAPMPMITRSGTAALGG